MKYKTPNTLLRVNQSFGAGRTASGLFPQVSRTELGKRLGVSKSVVSNVLRGRYEPSMELLMKMADELGMSAPILVAALAEQKVLYKRNREVREKRAREVQERKN